MLRITIRICICIYVFTVTTDVLHEEQYSMFTMLRMDKLELDILMLTLFETVYLTLAA